jgi:DNA polymerase-3 subunit beta
VDVEAEGRYTISSKFLTSYIALIQDADVLVSLEKGGSIAFVTASSETKFKGTSPDKFPSIPTIPSGSRVSLGARDIRTAIEKTLFSTADGSVRPMLAGIYIRSVANELIFASTDSFRLSEFRITGTESVALTPIIIPERAANELSRLLTDDIKTVDICTHESQLLATIGPVRLTSRLLSGKFPDYESFFPTEFRSKSVVLRSEFSNALKKANLVARQNNYNTRIRSKHE